MIFYLEKKHDESHDTLITLNRSLEASHQRFKTYYRHLLNQFDLISIVTQYYLNEVRSYHSNNSLFHILKNAQIKQQYQLQLSKGKHFRE